MIITIKYSTLFVCRLKIVLSWTKKIVTVDVIIVNSVMWAEGWERNERVKSQRGGAFATRQGTGVDGNSPPRARNWLSK